MSKLLGMTFTLEMDRPIMKKHYILPGGYEMNGKRFDFVSFYGTVDGSHVKCECYDLDDCMDAIYLDDIATFTEFYVYTGEDDDPEIHPVRVTELVFLFADGDTRANEEIVKSINDKI